MDQLEVLRDVVRRLEGAGLPYMLTGAAAGVYYGIPRYTRDLDLVIEIGEEDVGRIVAMFRPDYYLAEVAILEAVRRRSLFNLVNLERMVKVDLIVRRLDRYGTEAFRRRVRVQIQGLDLWATTPEDLILSKLLAMIEGNSDQQRIDVQGIMRGCPDLDRHYLADWSGHLDLSSELNSLWP